MTAIPAKTKGENPFKTYYVYHHINPETEEIVYIGIGTRDRAWQYQNRQDDHKQWLDRLFNEGFTLDAIVEVQETNISKDMALAIELESINRIKPKFNRNFRRNGVCKLDEAMLEKALCMRENGFYYTEIAEVLGVATMTIHRALNGGTKKYNV